MGFQLAAENKITDTFFVDELLNSPLTGVLLIKNNAQLNTLFGKFYAADLPQSVN